MRRSAERTEWSSHPSSVRTCVRSVAVPRARPAHSTSTAISTVRSAKRRVAGTCERSGHWLVLPCLQWLHRLHREKRQPDDDEEARIPVGLGVGGDRRSVADEDLQVLLQLSDGEEGIAVRAVGVAGTRFGVAVAVAVIAAFLRASGGIGVHDAVAARGGGVFGLRHGFWSRKGIVS